jgi:deoxyribodipyrimidine photo-lyase
MTRLLLFWHRRDLRLADNLGLAAAYARSQHLVGVFCLNPGIAQRGDMAPARLAYLLGCLQELHRDWQAAGSRLLLLSGHPQVTLPALAQALRAEAVYWNLDVEPESRRQDQAVQQALTAHGITVVTQWDQLLISPDRIATGTGQPYSVYGPFWKNWTRQPKAEPLAAPAGLADLSEIEIQALAGIKTIALPRSADLGFHWDRGFPLAPGARAAQDRLAEFCQQAIASYDLQRNFPGEDGTSRLSAALTCGALGIRTAWQASVSMARDCRREGAIASVGIWQQELAWREFYQHALYHLPSLAEGPYRPLWKHFPWENNPARFQAWCDGQTGYPIVDAAMRQLNETGWMHNRCRMIVASFLVKDLIIDWRWGEQYFMQNLVDGDLAANNGGWQWSASSGMDPKPLRIFNPASQARKFDPQALYIRQWLPELRRVSPEDLISGEILPLERQGYPAPIVDHHRQQQHFKALYARQKAEQSA